MKVAPAYAAQLGWSVVPLHSVRPDGLCTCGHVGESKDVCECGDPKCPRKHGRGSIGKHPRLRDWVREASSEADQVDAWVAVYPGANIGVATGQASGFFVLDVDPEHGGPDSLVQLEANHGPLPRTVQAVTGSGGFHYLFNMPAHAVTNSAGHVGDGLDIRGDGGQIVVAPSRSAKGVYRWVNSPWDTEIANAPDWLLAELRRPPAPSTPGASSTARGYFPAASPAVLEAAAEALEQHGPAVTGKGGGVHTFTAAALLVHDFALTDAEAWPLFVEWNKGCDPPWDLEGSDSLRVMLGRGHKYGKAEYGCRRSMDAVEAARKLITDWQTGPGGSESMFAMIALVKPLAGTCGDPARRDVIERELAQATGIGRRALALPKAVVAATPKGPGEIRVTTELHKVADDAIRAMAPRLFARNGVLCEVVKAERTFIYDMEVNRVLDLMSASAVYVRNDPEKGTVTQAPPSAVASILHARRNHPGVRVLEAITTAPIFLANGTILKARGYSKDARVYLEPDVEVDVPEAPSRDLAVAAVKLFRDLLCDFTFSSDADFAAWLAALLSPLVKSATGNAPSPLFCVSAPSPGAGKTLLTEVIAQIVTGGSAEVRPYNPRDASEWGKRLTSFVKAAAPVSVFDNVNGQFGDEGLDRLITSSTWSDRLLGASEAPPLPVVTTWMATGNNIEPVGDTVRRVLVVRLEVKTERPQERTGFRRPLLVEHAREHRAALLSAALTILRAYHVAGRPRQPLASWGSFVTWSNLVRGALVWAGLSDPYLTQQRASAELNEPENEAHDFWISVVEASDGQAASVVALANQRDAQGVLGARSALTVFTVKGFIARFIDKPRLQKRIRRERDSVSGRVTYRVESI